MTVPVAASVTGGTSTAALTGVVLGLAAIIAALSAVLVGIRLRRELRERRRARLSREPRRLLLELAADPDDAGIARLLAVSPAAWRALEPTAIALLGKLRGEARATLVEVFERRGAVQQALTDLTDNSPATRARATQTLGVLARPDAVDPVRELLTDPEPFVRAVAVRALGALRDPRAAPDLVRVLDHGVPAHLVSDALSRIGPAALPALHAALGDDHPAAGAAVLDALSLIGDPRSVQPITALLEHEADPQVLVAAARSLGRIGHPSALPSLHRLTRADHPRQVRIEALRAVGAAGATLGSAELSDLVQDDDPHVAHEAAQALRRIGPAGVVHLERITATAPGRPDAARPAALHAAEALALARIDANLVVRRAHGPARAGRPGAGANRP